MQRMPRWLRYSMLVAALGWCIGIQPATAHQYTQLHAFTGGPVDGSHPLGSLTLSGSTLYGTTYAGGGSNCGVVFKIGIDGNGYTILHNFTSGNGPEGSLTMSGSTLYGMMGCVVFKINSDGAGYTILHTFDNFYGDGSSPKGCSLTLSDSTLYGMTTCGGSGSTNPYGGGTVFKINTDGSGYTIIHNFTGNPTNNSSSDGCYPTGDLTLSGSALYGMTSLGGSNNCGVVFKMNADGSGYTILHNFTGGDGKNPPGSLTLSGSTLYGMTNVGGNKNCGVAFKMNTDGSDYTILHSFGFGSNNGGYPDASLTLSDSILYGTAALGGSGAGGIVFQMNTDGSDFTILHNFTGDGNGAVPRSTLALSGSTLYGTTYNANGVDCGGVFSLSLLTQIAPTIKANGAEMEIAINYPEALSITVAMNTGDYAGVPVDWWVAARAGSSWYYFNDLGQWIEDGNVLNWHPVYQGPLFALPATPVLNITGLPVGAYTFYFAVDFPMDGVLNLDGPVLVDSVNVAVQ